MSSAAENDIAEAIGRTIMRWQDATEDFDEAFGRLHGLSAPERRCLGLIAFGPQTARAIATETGLTPASITALLDRLEARNLLTRRPDPDDRRKIMVSATRKALSLIEEAYGPIQREGAALLMRYSREEQDTILRFVADALELQSRLTRDFLTRQRSRSARTKPTT
jgi:DNA-binding MarR family transcriptional regulator